MSRNTHQKNYEQKLVFLFETPRKLDWIVPEDPKLQAELNGLSENGKKVSPQVVNKVVDRIKSL